MGILFRKANLFNEFFGKQCQLLQNNSTLPKSNTYQTENSLLILRVLNNCFLGSCSNSSSPSSPSDSLSDTAGICSSSSKALKETSLSNGVSSSSEMLSKKSLLGRVNKAEFPYHFYSHCFWLSSLLTMLSDTYQL